MLHLVLYGLLAVVLAGVLFLIASRFLPAGEQIAPALRDEPPWELPEQRRLEPADVDGVRLPVALRGYRFAETDVLLDRLAAELRARDDEIARLRGTAPDVDDEDTTADTTADDRTPDDDTHDDDAPGDAAVDDVSAGDEPAADDPATDEALADDERR